MIPRSSEINRKGNPMKISFEIESPTPEQLVLFARMVKTGPESVMRFSPAMKEAAEKAAREPIFVNPFYGGYNPGSPYRATMTGWERVKAYPGPSEEKDEADSHSFRPFLPAEVQSLPVQKARGGPKPVVKSGIIRALSQGRPVYLKDIAAGVGRPVKSIYPIIDRLIKAGHVLRVSYACYALGPIPYPMAQA